MNTWLQIYIFWCAQLKLLTSCHFLLKIYIDGYAQDCSNTIVNAIELPQSCTKPLQCWTKPLQSCINPIADLPSHQYSHCLPNQWGLCLISVVCGPQWLRLTSPLHHGPKGPISCDLGLPLEWGNRLVVPAWKNQILFIKRSYMRNTRRIWFIGRRYVLTGILLIII